MTPTTSPRVALITGASRGLGAALARLMAGQGFALVLTARGDADLRALAASLDAPPERVVALPGDVADPAHRRALAAAATRFGRLDLLINNASTLGPLPMRSLADFPPDALAEVFAVNVLAPVALAQETLPLLKAARGLIVNVSSDAAVGGYEGWGGYGASKAALDLASLTLANELRADGIGVVAVDPGDMNTGMHADAYPGEDISALPRPEETLPFWAWLLNRDPMEISGQRLLAQSDVWEVRGEAG